MFRARALAFATAAALAVVACDDDDDEVITEPAPALPADVVDTLANAGTFTTLLTAVSAADLETTLRGEGPFTVFAPPDSVFQQLPPGTVESLLVPEQRDRLRAIITYHVVPGRFTSEQLRDVSSLETVNGKPLPVTTQDGTILVGGTPVISPDIQASNGVVHVIDGVLIPPP